MVDNVVKFMGHIAMINKHLLEADAIFDDESGVPKGAFNPAKKRVSRTGV